MNGSSTRRNHGSYLLARSGATEETIAAQVGVTRQAVHLWLHSQSKPTDAKRGIIARVWSVPAASWDEEIPNAPLLSSSPSGADESRETFSFFGVADELKRTAQDLLRSMRDQGATPAERSKVGKDVANILNTLAKTDRDLARRVFASPQWSQLEKKLAEVLARYPDAARAVEIAVETMIAEADYE